MCPDGMPGASGTTMSTEASTEGVEEVTLMFRTLISVGDSVLCPSSLLGGSKSMDTIGDARTLLFSPPLPETGR